MRIILVISRYGRRSVRRNAKHGPPYTYAYTDSVGSRITFSIRHLKYIKDNFLFFFLWFLRRKKRKSK